MVHYPLLFRALRKRKDGSMVSPPHKAICAYKLSLVLALLISLLGESRRALAQPLKEIRIGSSNISVTNICTYYARDRKFFEREGLDVKIIIVKTEAAIPAVVAGNLDYTTLSTSSIEATLRGMPLRLVAVTNQQPLVGLVVREGIKQVTDLKGKKLSVSSFGGATYGAALYLLKSHGLRPKEDVAILATGTNVARIAALKQEAVDAVLISAPDDIRIAKEGFKILVDVGTTYKLLWGGVSTTLTKIRENPAEVKRVVRAVVRATRSITEPQNKDDVISYISAFFKLDRTSSDEFYRRLVPSLSPTGMVDRDKIKLVIDSAVERGLTDKPLDPDVVVDFSFVKDL
jgi:ABC-type nitrate/sulfonate/bicarbonate transport system substrate-binding protein